MVMYAGSAPAPRKTRLTPAVAAVAATAPFTGGAACMPDPRLLRPSTAATAAPASPPPAEVRQPDTVTGDGAVRGGP